MLGHDPDWTHHTSEDKIDKTDASEFRRVGVLASAASYRLAFISGPHELLPIAGRSMALELAELTRRVGSDLPPCDCTPSPLRRLAKNQALLASATKSWQVTSDFLAKREARFFVPIEFGQPAVASAPSRLAIIPFDSSVFESVSPEDAKWLSEQEARFASDAEGLATKPNFGLISFEAVNFMDGHRSTAEIADLLAAEYLLDIDQAWVDRLVSILEKQKLVTVK
jgi:hypothetical protein